MIFLILVLIIGVAFFKALRDYVGFKYGKIRDGFWGIRSDTTNDAWHWSEKGRQACWACAVIIALIIPSPQFGDLQVWIFGLMTIAFTLAVFHYLFYHLIFKKL